MLINARGRGLLVVGEDEPPQYFGKGSYDDEGSERSSTGSVIVGEDSYWRATISVPIPKADTVFVKIEREGTLPAGYMGAEETASWSMPMAELDLLMKVLAGVIRQGRRDGVIS
jgi:hypothetical protein